MFPQAKQQLMFIFTAVCASALASTALAQGSGRQANKAAASQSAAPTAPAKPGNDTDKIDVTDLENKYWAAKDTDFNVVQNRLYSKANRFALSGFYGNLLNDPWTDGQAYGGSLAYFFSDRYGIEGSYSYIDSKDNKAVQRLMSQNGGVPNYNKMKGFYGASFVWVPFYAKMSLLNFSIIYFDMSFALGAGMQDYQQQRDDANVTKSTPAVTFDVTQHFFLNKYFAIRIDLKNRWYRDEVAWYRSTSVVNGNRTASTDNDNTTLLMFGLTLLY